MKSEKTESFERKSAIVRILRQHVCESQDEVVAYLRKDGFEIKQSSISRDFRDLGVAKVGGRYVAVQEDNSTTLFIGSKILSSIPVGDNLVVVRTETGAASIVALKFDQLDIAGVAGSLAGDDTVFIATSTKKAQRRVLDVFGTASHDK